MANPTVKDAQRMAKNLVGIVNTYLTAKAFAQVERENVDKIEREILQSTPYYADGNENTKTTRADGSRITEPKRTYLMHEKDLHSYLTELRNRLEAAGYKIEPGYERDGSISKDRWSYACPALVAEDLERLACNVVIEAAAKELGYPSNYRDKLICSGMDNYRKFVELTVKLVVNSKYYTKPSLAA